VHELPKASGLHEVRATAGEATAKCWDREVSVMITDSTTAKPLLKVFGSEAYHSSSHVPRPSCPTVCSFCTAVKRLSQSKKRRQDCLMLSAQSFSGLCLQLVAYSLPCCFSGNVPLFHTSRYVIPRDSVLPGLPLH